MILFQCHYLVMSPGWALTVLELKSLPPSPQVRPILGEPFAGPQSVPYESVTSPSSCASTTLGP